MTGPTASQREHNWSALDLAYAGLSKNSLCSLMEGENTRFGEQMLWGPSRMQALHLGMQGTAIEWIRTLQR